MGILRCRHLWKCMHLVLVSCCLTYCSPMNKLHVATSEPVKVDVSTSSSFNPIKYALFHDLRGHIDVLESEIDTLDAQYSKLHPSQPNSFMNYVYQNPKTTKKIEGIKAELSTIKTELVQKKREADSVIAELSNLDIAAGKLYVLDRVITEMKNVISQFDEAFTADDSNNLDWQIRQLNNVYNQKIYFQTGVNDLSEWDASTGVSKELYSELVYSFHNYALIKILAQSRFKIYDMKLGLEELFSDLQHRSRYGSLSKFAPKWFGAISDIQKLQNKFNSQTKLANLCLQRVGYLGGPEKFEPFNLPLKGKNWKIVFEAPEISVPTGPDEFSSIDSSTFIHNSMGPIQWLQDATYQLKKELKAFRKELLQSVLKEMHVDSNVQYMSESVSARGILMDYTSLMLNYIGATPIVPIVNLERMKLELMKYHPTQLMKAPTVETDDLQAFKTASHEYQMTRSLCEMDILSYQQLNVLETFIASQKTILEGFDVNTVSILLTQWRDLENAYNQQNELYIILSKKRFSEQDPIHLALSKHEDSRGNIPKELEMSEGSEMQGNIPKKLKMTEGSETHDSRYPTYSMGREAQAPTTLKGFPSSNDVGGPHGQIQ